MTEINTAKEIVEGSEEAEDLEDVTPEQPKVEIDNSIPEQKKDMKWIYIGGAIIIIAGIYFGLKYMGVI